MTAPEDTKTRVLNDDKLEDVTGGCVVDIAEEDGQDTETENDGGNGFQYIPVPPI